MLGWATKVFAFLRHSAGQFDHDDTIIAPFHAAGNIATVQNEWLRADRRMQNKTNPRVMALATTLLFHVLIISLLLFSQETRPTSRLSSDAAGSGSLVFVALPLAPAQPAGSPNTSTRDTVKSSALPERSFLGKTDSGTAIVLPAQSAIQGDEIIGSPQENAADTALEFRERLHDHIAQFRQYPVALNPKRIDGRVEVEFVMSRKGAILNIWISHSSGNIALDKAAVETVLRAQPLPAIPANLPDPIEIALPVDFSVRL
jgi:protein TonB